MESTGKRAEYESQFRPGTGTVFARREISRINRIVARMLKAGVPKSEIDFLIKAYTKQGEISGRSAELSRQMFELLEIDEAKKN